MGLSITDRFWLLVFDCYRLANRIRVQIAESDADIDACHTLAQEVFSDSGYHDASGQAIPLPNVGNHRMLGMVKRKGIVVGMIDVVRSEHRFPVQYFFNVDLPTGIQQSEFAELARIAVLPEYRKRNSVVSMALMALALKYSEQHNIKRWIMCAPALLRQGFREFFTDLTVLPEKEIAPLQNKFREHREYYFHPRHGVQVFIINVAHLSIGAIARVLVRRRWARLRSKRRARSKKS